MMCSPKRKAEGALTWKRKGQGDHKGRGWSAVATSQGMPAATRSYKDPRIDSLLESLEGVCSPADILILDVWPP